MRRISDRDIVMDFDLLFINVAVRHEETSPELIEVTRPEYD